MANESLPAPRKTKSPATYVSPKVAEMLDLMVETGLSYQDAALAVGIHVRSARRALDRPHVLSNLVRNILTDWAARAAGRSSAAWSPEGGA
jgi:hypothetical protein